MNKQERKRDIEAKVGNYVSISAGARYLNISRESFRKLMKDALYDTTGKGKRFTAADVAERIVQSSKVMI